MPPVAAAAALPALAAAGGRLVVQESPVLEQGDEFELDSAPLTVGRGGQNDVAIDGDEFASARHVRFEPRRDGVWVHDLGSTNGTYVNGVRIDRRAQARARRRRPRRRDRPEVRGSDDDRLVRGQDGHRPEAAPERGLVRRRAAALRGRRRHGRRAGAARSRRSSPPPRSRTPIPAGSPARERVASLIQEANRRVLRALERRPGDVGHGNDDDRRARRGRRRRRSATSATRARTSCATAASSSSPRTTRSSTSS